MAVELVDATKLDACCTAEANAIRAKTGGSSPIAFDYANSKGFADAIAAIPTGGGGIDISEYVDIPPTALSGLISLTSTQIRDYAFAYYEGTKTWSVEGNSVTYIGQNAFRQCRMLTSARFPNLTGYNGTSYIFYMPTSGERRLTLIDWGQANVPGNWATNCMNLVTIILRKTSIATLANINSFNGTPFASGGTGGTIYIPQSLYNHLGDGGSSDYKAASNWSTIDGYGTITWAQIEGSPYEL